MSIDHLANQDFERALLKSFFRKVVTWLTGKSNDLLPFNEVKARMPLRGQHYVGLHQIPIDQIVGSMGRYRDFDRAFLPRQKRTKDRWISIDRAHYQEIELPPVDLYKMGEVYFVKDGNHRVSVARERGQVFIDAFVTEIDIPILLTADLVVDDLELKSEYANFLEKTRLTAVRESAQIELTLPGEYERLLEHISVHRWYLGEQRRAEVPYEEAVASWYDSIYLPLVSILEKEKILDHFPGRTVADLYLWTIEYLWYRREALKEEYAFEEAAHQFIKDSSDWPVDRLANLLKKATWVDYLILEQERASFLAHTRLTDARPEAKIELTMPGFYGKMLEHIDVHRWFLGTQRGSDIPYEEAVISWYDNVYRPLVDLIRVQQILDEFPGRTEADLYLWIIEHQGFLRETYGSELSIEQATERFKQEFVSKNIDKTLKRHKRKKRGSGKN
jgi:hypothetical protein